MRKITKNTHQILLLFFGKSKKIMRAVFLLQIFGVFYLIIFWNREEKNVLSSIEALCWERFVVASLMKLTHCQEFITILLLQYDDSFIESALTDNITVFPYWFSKSKPIFCKILKKWSLFVLFCPPLRPWGGGSPSSPLHPWFWPYIFTK